MGLSLESGFSRRQRYLLELEEASARAQALPLETDTGPRMLWDNSISPLPNVTF